jgi:hypothetical protein
MELAPLVGLADVIVDLVSTGNTLRANDLVAVEDIMPITSRLIVNPGALKLKRTAMQPLIDALAEGRPTMMLRPSRAVDGRSRVRVVARALIAFESAQDPRSMPRSRPSSPTCARAATSAARLHAPLRSPRRDSAAALEVPAADLAAACDALPRAQRDALEQARRACAAITSARKAADSR